jgi:hypothetical protein
LDKPCLAWIGGWAFPLDAWEPWLQEAYPDFCHVFLDAHALLDRAELDRELLGLPGGALVVAWSLGSLLALEACAEGRWPRRLPLLCACPVADFCAPTGRWRPRVLDRMAAALALRREAVLEDFRRLMWPDMPSDLAAAWARRVETIPDAALAAGLMALRDRRVDLSRLSGADISCLVCRDDPVSPPWQGGAPFLALERGGHVPFLAASEAFGWELSKRSSQA